MKKSMCFCDKCGVMMGEYKEKIVDGVTTEKKIPPNREPLDIIDDNGEEYFATLNLKLVRYDDKKKYKELCNNCQLEVLKLCVEALEDRINGRI